MRKMNLLSSVIAALCVISIYGCSGGDSVQREDVSGSATFDGAPIVFGQIQFMPDQAMGHDAPPGYADIVDGKYDTSLEGGQGIVPGPHKIQITGYAKEPVMNEDETQEVEEELPLFDGYTIEESIQPPTYDIVVPAEATEGNSRAGNSASPNNEP